MNYNLITYCLYLPIICFIMVKVGWLFYKHGEIFLLNMFHYNESLVKSVNNLLLIGYYLINLGYAIYSIAYWTHVDSVTSMINTLSTRLGEIIIILAILHYNNVLCLTFIVKRTLKKHTL